MLFLRPRPCGKHNRHGFEETARLVERLDLPPAVIPAFLTGILAPNPVEPPENLPWSIVYYIPDGMLQIFDAL